MVDMKVTKYNKGYQLTKNNITLAVLEYSTGIVSLHTLPQHIKNTDQVEEYLQLELDYSPDDIVFMYDYDLQLEDYRNK